MASNIPVTPLQPTSGYAVTPSDTAVFPPSVIYVSAVGATPTIAVQPADANCAPITVNAFAGQTIPFLCTKVLATGTLNITQVLRAG
jgi:hypothetical protein